MKENILLFGLNMNSRFYLLFVLIIAMIFIASCGKNQNNQSIRDIGTQTSEPIRRSSVEDLGQIGSINVELNITPSVEFDMMAGQTEMRSRDRRAAQRQASGASVALINATIAQFGTGIYSFENINATHIADVRLGTFGNWRWNASEFRFRVEADVFQKNITAPSELSNTNETGVIDIHLIVNELNVALIFGGVPVRDLLHNDMLDEALRLYSNTIDVINIDLSGSLATGQALVDLTKPRGDSVNQLMSRLRNDIPQDASVSIGEINTSIRQLQNNITNEIDAYLKGNGYRVVRNRANFRITGRVDGQGSNRQLHLQLTNTRTGNVVNTISAVI